MLVARDAGPSNCFKLLAVALTALGYEVILLVGGGQPLTCSNEEIENAVKTADLVLLGMSATAQNAEPEVLAGLTAKSAGVTYGFYFDVPDCHLRARPGSWFADLVKETAFCCGVVAPEEAREVFAYSDMFPTGNPVREMDCFVREELQGVDVRAQLGVAPDERLVLAPGGHFPDENLIVWINVLRGLHLWVAQATGRKFKLVLTRHPGERPNGSALYQEFAKLTGARYVPEDEFKTADIVHVADLVAERTSSAGIQAAYLGVSVITLASQKMLKYYESAVGKGVLPEALAKGVSWMVPLDDDETAANAIALLFTAEGSARIRENQLKYYPRPMEPRVALRKLAMAIETMLAE